MNRKKERRFHTREKLSITPDMIRLSVGIEAQEDIGEDLEQALDTL